MKDLRPPLYWVLIAKGIGITLVVVGHFFPANSPEYWSVLRNTIYTFHMPLFFFLSGYLYNYSKYRYRTLLSNKIKRLAYPFISMALLFFAIKTAASYFVSLEHPVDSQSIGKLLTSPDESFAPLLWFVHALFLMFIMYPLIRKVFTSDITILLFFVSSYLIFGGSLPVFDNAIRFIPFFIFGIVFREREKVLSSLTSGKWWPAICTSALFLGSYYLLGFGASWGDRAEYVVKLGLGLSGALAVIAISACIDKTPNISRKALGQIGTYSMTIYLFHVFFESGVRIFFQQVLGTIDSLFAVVAFIAIVAGIVFPLYLEKYLLRKLAITRRYILGLS